MSGRIINTNIRLNLDKEDDRRAWEHLQRLDRSRYKSYSRAVVAALNDYFDRQERLRADPYLETREKEDAFLQRVLDTVERVMRSTAQPGSSSQCVAVGAFAPSDEPAPSNSAEGKDSEQSAVEETLLDFIDSF